MTATATLEPASMVLERGIASSADREVWLAARRKGVTATEVKRLMQGGVLEQHKLVEEKRSGFWEDLSGNRYVRRGNEREPVIGEWIERKVGIAHNDVLIRSAENPRHLATPDGIGVVGGEILVSEIKASKYDLTPERTKNGRLSRTSKFWKSGYYWQVQWQLYVAGATRCLFVWEQHDDNWPNPQPVSLEPEWAWIERDEKAIADLIGLADAALAELDAPADTAGVDLEVDRLAMEVLEARGREAAAKTARLDAWSTLTDLMEARGGDAGQASDCARVTWKAGHTEVVDSPDVQAAKDADPALFAEVEALAKRWNAHQAKYVKHEERPVPGRLTVTAVKKGKNQ